jgi:hypothetical protein
VAKEPQLTGTSTSTFENLEQISDNNLRKMRNAYRHPFEYISPLLYGRSESFDMKATEIFIADEDEYLK